MHGFAPRDIAIWLSIGISVGTGVAVSLALCMLAAWQKPAADAEEPTPRITQKFDTSPRFP
jgi:hypothetical protein